MIWPNTPKLKQQMTEDHFHAINNRIRQVYISRIEQATDYAEELKKPAAFFSIQHDTFYIDYIGSMHKTGYSDQMTDVRFLCQPAGGNTLHLNVIEHNGEFRVTCLAMSDVSAIAEALELTERFSDPEDKAFVNGILGTILREYEAQA